MPKIRTSTERARGCGFRSKGLYIKMDAEKLVSCQFFSQPTEACSCCGLELRQTRSMALLPVRAIFPRMLQVTVEDDISEEELDLMWKSGWDPIKESQVAEGKKDRVCVRTTDPDAECCGLYHEILTQYRAREKYLVDWVGSGSYSTSADFIREARIMGISRKVAGIPEGLVLGKTRIILAHPKAHMGKPGFFGSYVPTAIEYVIGGDETAEQLESLDERGYDLVDVKRMYDEQTSMFEFAPATGVQDAVNQDVEHLTINALRNELQKKYPSDMDMVDKLVNENLAEGKHSRLASKIYGFLTKDLLRPSSRGNLFKKYTQMRVDEYKKNLNAQ